VDEARRAFVRAAKALALKDGTWKALFDAYWQHYVKARIPKPGSPKPAMLVEFKYFTNAAAEKGKVLGRAEPDAETVTGRSAAFFSNKY